MWHLGNGTQTGVRGRCHGRRGSINALLPPNALRLRRGLGCTGVRGALGLGAGLKTVPGPCGVGDTGPRLCTVVQGCPAAEVAQVGVGTCLGVGCRG